MNVICLGRREIAQHNFEGAKCGVSAWQPQAAWGDAALLHDEGVYGFEATSFKCLFGCMPLKTASLTIAWSLILLIFHMKA